MTDHDPHHRSDADHPPIPEGGELTVEDGLTLLTCPSERGEIPPAWQAWVEASAPDSATPSVWMTFQRASVAWRPGRAVVSASADRLASATGAVREGVRYEMSLQSIERAASEGWTDLEADSASAFEPDPGSPKRRAELLDRYRRTVAWRARLARIAPYLLSPLVHPPTLGSQIGDRWRERLRMEARYEAVEAQLEVYHDVYDACGQRTSEARLARAGHTLEWAIVVILVLQSLFWLFDILGSLSAE